MSIQGQNTRPGGTYDADLLFKDAGLVAASAAAQVSAAAEVIDIGAGLFRACMILDVAAIEVADTSEIYDICVQLSNSPTFASGIVTAAQIELGAAAVLLGDAASTPGRYKLMWDNEYNGTMYGYARVYTKVAGTIATGINYTAWATEIK